MSDRTFGFGIDLGTSNSAITRVDISSGRPNFFEGKDLGGHREIPSVVYFHPDGTMEFGTSAKSRSRAKSEAPRVIANIKLLLRQNDPLEIPGLTEPIAPTKIVRGILAYLKECAERTLNMPCSRAVISVPAFEDFDVDYRARVRDAVMDGEPLFESITTIPEPDAVLMSIGDLTNFMGQRVLVFDMGGGTLDVSIRDVTNRDDRPYLTQLAVVGSSAAGRRVTEALLHRAIERWQRDKGFTFSGEELEWVTRTNFLEFDDLKRNLSDMVAQFGHDAKKSLNGQLFSDNKDYSVGLQAGELTELSRPICAEAIETVERALAAAGCRRDDIDAYFVVGGSAQLPLLRESLHDYFGKPSAPLMGRFGSIDPTLAVVRGAAVEDLERNEAAPVPASAPVLERRIPYSISIVTDGEKKTVELVPQDSVLPYGPVEKSFWVPNTGDRQIEIRLVRGSGDPKDCSVIAPATVDLLEDGVKDDQLRITWYVDPSGEMIVHAFDKKDRGLGVIRTTHY